MVEAAPPAPFIVTQAKLLFELLIIALNAPTQLCQINQAIEGDTLGQGGEPIFGWFGFVLRPFDQQPLFAARSARCHGAPAARAAGQSARRANPRFPRAK